MAKYEFSGKINPSGTLFAFLLAIPASILLGTVYAFLMELNPLILLDIVIFVLLIVGLMGLTIGLNTLGKVRNRLVKLVLACVVSVLTFYFAWAYLVLNDFWEDILDVGKWGQWVWFYIEHASFSIGKMTSSSSLTIEGVGIKIMYAIETLVFLIPVFVYLPKNKEYFCESCQKFNRSKVYHLLGSIPENEVYRIENNGSLNYLTNFKCYTGTIPLTEKIAPDQPVLEMSYSWCKHCGGNGVVNIYSGTLTPDQKKETYVFTQTGKVIVDTLVDTNTAPIFKT